MVLGGCFLKSSNANKKQALCIASVASNLDNFNRDNVSILLGLGYEVTLAANFHSKEDINSQEKIDAFAKEMRAEGVHIVHIDFSRSLKKVDMQIKSVFQVKELLKRRYALIHCHSPICSAIVRRAAEVCRRKIGTKVVYTAHGFHFYSGAPIKNWLLYYPIEKWMSRYTDILITINREDYQRAKKRFYAKKTVYVPGVGINMEQFHSGLVDKEEKRRKLGLENTDIMLLSVGELNRNKNHAVAIRALAGLDNRNLHYFIAGKGNLGGELMELAGRLGISRQVHLLGYRTDVPDLMRASDVYLLPSIREGLNVSLMEAMASGLPCVCSDIRGNRDLIKNGSGGYLADALDVAAWQEAISKVLVHGQGFGGKNAEKIAKGFSNLQVWDAMKKIYIQI